MAIIATRLIGHCQTEGIIWEWFRAVGKFHGPDHECMHRELPPSRWYVPDCEGFKIPSFNGKMRSAHFRGKFLNDIDI